MAELSLDQKAEGTPFKFRWRYLIALIILVPVVAHLFFAVSRSPLTNYYITVDELRARAEQGNRLRVGAAVVPGSINWDRNTRALSFHLQGDAAHLPVTYRGFAPETLRDGATAIVEGELNAAGTFIAYDVLVKCPHAYVPG
ncbi:MAG: cytochrome c maturation protein CcmE [Chloroflexi bacterium]|nr:cytochrome c maturation protein CcmE [Chloroflexota bacterium]